MIEKNRLIGASIVKQTIHLHEKPTHQTCAPRPRYVAGTEKDRQTKHPEPDPSETSPAAAVAAACHGVCAAMPLDLMPSGQNPIVYGTAAYRPRLSPARFLPLLIFQQQNARGHYAARLRPTKQTPGRVHTAGGRATYR